MKKKIISKGIVHEVPTDLREILTTDQKALAMWQNITPLARNEWICWIISVKTVKTRKEHLLRTISELKKGVRRPCCWMGCIHRTDKKLSPSQKFILGKGSKK